MIGFALHRGDMPRQSYTRRGRGIIPDGIGIMNRLSPEEISSILDSVEAVNQLLLSRRNAQKCWTGELSTSALSTATAVMALLKAVEAAPDDERAAVWTSRIDRGLLWLSEHQNPDGGWGDTVLSISNISTSMLALAVFRFVRRMHDPVSHVRSGGKSSWNPTYESTLQSAARYVDDAGGVAAVIRRYGKDRTFSVPILTHCALAGTVSWTDVIPLPFELSCIPHRFYSAVRMPVVSYALPALIAIGQVIFRNQSHANPIIRWIRRRAIMPSLRVLESIQPPNGGFLEATPLTSFVCMSLIGCELLNHSVTGKCLRFIEASVRADGSWPIDTNLSTWVTTLSVNALCISPSSSDDASRSSVTVTNNDAHDRVSTQRIPNDDMTLVRNWLISQQYREIHPYTNAAPGGWSWTDLPGGVPDADDTPGAMLALLNMRADGHAFSDGEIDSLRAAVVWLLNLQNRDGGWPTFCRGWGTLPFDRSSSDLSAHSVRALNQWLIRVPEADDRLRNRVQKSVIRGIRFLRITQRSDGTWLPLWFGHQHNTEDENPLYGTSRVVLAFTALKEETSPSCKKAVDWLVNNQNDDGGWAARRGLESSVEETGLALDSLADLANHPDYPAVRIAVDRAAHWLSLRVNEGTVVQATPIGFYFARLWYFEELYPIIFAVAGLNRWKASVG